MKSVIIFIVFYTLLLSNNIAQQSKKIKGFVKNNEGQTLSFTLIYNSNSHQTFSANQYGAFVVEANIGDSLVLSRMSYQTDTFVVSKAVYYETIIFEMILKRKEILLKDVTINYHHKFDSMAKISAQIMKHDVLLNNHTRVENLKEMAKPKLISTGGIGVEGLIYKTWYKFSDAGKSNEKLLKIISIYNESVKLDDKLNIEFIMKITGVNEKKAEFIKQYCIKSKLLGHSNYNDYDLILALKACAE
jgi:cytochrome c oxidase subunit IV